MLILGSKSPRRKEILEKSGIDFIIVTKDVEENIKENDPDLFTMKTAEKKANAIINDYPNDIILCADTVVACDNKILGKPHNKEEAYQMIKMISGKSHKVVTGVYLGNIHEHQLFSVSTIVNVKKLTEDQINEYINTKEPYDKAGAYAIQGLFGKYIESINGEYENVVGLPIEEIKKKLNLIKR